MTRISTFCSSRCVAKLCRNVCMDTRLSISAACVAAWTARLSCRVLSDSMGLRPATLEHLALSMSHAPPGAQAFEQDRREHGVAVPATLALFDSQSHALAVDITDPQRDDLAGA